MKLKRGQVSIFIIIAVIIVGLLILILVLKGDTIKFLLGKKLTEKELQELQITQAQAYVQECVESESKKSLFDFGISGGNLNPQKSFEFGEVNISCLYCDSQEYLSSLSGMEENLARLFNKNLIECVGELSVLKNENWDVEIREVDTKVGLKEKVFFNVNFPITAIKTNATVQLKQEYSEVINVNFKKYHDTVENMVNKQKIDSSNVDMFYLLNQRMFIRIAEKDNIMIYWIQDQNSILYGYPYSFIFAMELKNE